MMIYDEIILRKMQRREMIYLEKLLPWLEPAISLLDHYLKESSCSFSQHLDLKYSSTQQLLQITALFSFEDKKDTKISNISSGTFQQNIFLIYRS